MSLRVLQFGSSGQLGRALARDPTAARHDVMRLSRQEADLANPSACAARVKEIAPDLVLIAAAYTKVDQAEEDREAARIVNAEAPDAIAEAAAAIDAAVVHVSTDYVFGGDKPQTALAYREEDAARPRNIYGETKLAGERNVLAANSRSAVLRASWVFDGEGANFLTTMLRLGAERDVLRVVDDQISAPTYAPDLAAILWRVGEGLVAGGQPGLFHVQSAPYTSWAGFAEAIFERAEPGLGRRPKVIRIPSSDYPTKAERPLDTRLDGARLREAYGVQPPDWRLALDRIVQKPGT